MNNLKTSQQVCATGVVLPNALVLAPLHVRVHFGNHSEQHAARYFSATATSSRNRRKAWRIFSAGETQRGEYVDPFTWSTETSPYEVLGVEQDCTADDIKAAFRRRVKEYHPDVYKGIGNAVFITKQLIQAYELLTNHMDQSTSRRKGYDPFEEPECEARDVFVYEFCCIGKGCPYSCVERAPHVFRFAPGTGRARAVAQGYSEDYAVQLAVGQCPRNCIHYVTPLQRRILEEILWSALEGTRYSDEVTMLEGLLSQANFQNGRYQLS